MARYKGRIGHFDTLGLKRAHCGDGCRHQRGLRVLRQGQRVLLALPDQGREFLAQSVIDLVEHRLGFWIGLRQITAHADCLRPLPRKYICPAHRILP